MADALVENGLEFLGHVTNKHWDKGYDRVRRYVNGKKVEDEYRPVQPRQQEGAVPSSSSSSNSRTGFRSALQSHDFNRKTPRRRSLDLGGTVALVEDPVAYQAASALSGSRRKQLKTLPPPPRGAETEFTRDRETVIAREIEESDRVLRRYEAEANDPKRNPASVLNEKHLWTLDRSRSASRRDSAMAYNDNYQQGSHYQGEGRARSAQPARSRVYDDDDSDYDERSGRRYGAGSGRGYDDRGRDDYRDYDRVVEETERYRGPRAERPWGADRRESYRDDPYGAGAVARRSDPALDRNSYASRPKSRGRDDRDRSYSRSPSRSRSRSREGGLRGAVGSAFDTSTRGLGVGLAGAVIGGLAGREFGKQQNRQRDIIIGALVGGLGANAATHKYQEWREDKREEAERVEERWEEKYQGRGRARSNVR